MYIIEHREPSTTAAQALGTQWVGFLVPFVKGFYTFLK